jgi:hypothetical protein
MMDPTTGRWLSQDPIGFAGGDGNLYRYVGNGPTDSTDPTGLKIKLLSGGKLPDFTNAANAQAFINTIGVTLGLYPTLTPQEIALAVEILQAYANSTEEYTFGNLQDLAEQVVFRLEIVNTAKNLDKSGIQYNKGSSIVLFPDAKYWYAMFPQGIATNLDAPDGPALQELFSAGSKLSCDCISACYLAILKGGQLYLFRVGRPPLLGTKKAKSPAGLTFFSDQTKTFTYPRKERLKGNDARTNPFIPGDILVFANPAATPAHRDARHEYTVYLGNGEVYGHGIGITTIGGMEQALYKLSDGTVCPQIESVTDPGTPPDPVEKGVR